MFPSPSPRRPTSGRRSTPADAGARYIAGGTTLVDLMRETVERPDALVDINALPLPRRRPSTARALRIGVLVRMSDWPPHPGCAVVFPVIAEALELSASAQLRNMASIGGNLMQRPRCLYFRDVTADCNRRSPAAGARRSAGSTAPTRSSATSDHCVATHPSDLAVAFVALDASSCTREARTATAASPSPTSFASPGSTPDREHDLRTRRADHRCRDPDRTGARAGPATSRCATGSPTSSR